MLSPVLFLIKTPKHHVPLCTTSLLFSKNSTGSKYLSEYNKKSYHSHITHFNPPTLILTSVVHHPTALFNPILIHSNTRLLRPSVTSSLNFSNRSIIHSAIAVPRLSGKNSRQHCDKYLTHPIRAHSNLSPCHLSTTLSLQTENTAL